MLAREIFSWTKFGGIALAVTAAIIIIKGVKKPKSIKGVLLSMTAALSYATVIILYQPLLKVFSSQSLTFFIFIIPAILNFLIMPNAKERVIKIVKDNGKIVVLACSFGGLANLAMNKSLSFAQSTNTLVIIESFLVVTLVGEHFFLKEKKNLLVELIGVGLAISGAILIRLS